MAAEVARSYFELRGAQQRLGVARENLASERQTLELTTLRDEAGRGSELDVQRSRARLKATEATIPPRSKPPKTKAPTDSPRSWASVPGHSTRSSSRNG